VLECWRNTKLAEVWMKLHNKNAENQYMDKVEKNFSKKNNFKRTKKLLEPNRRPVYDRVLYAKSCEGLKVMDQGSIPML
jgi:hypothetical protein